MGGSLIPGLAFVRKQGMGMGSNNNWYYKFTGIPLSLRYSFISRMV